jgi:KDO2-lipid IV(A) lauroyltransferase
MAERETRFPTVADRASYLLYKVFVSLTAVLPRNFVLAAGRGVGNLTFWLDGRHRTIALDNLAQALGATRNAAERRRIARRSFMNFVQSVFDSLKTAGWSREKILSYMDIEGLSHFQAAHAAGRGVLLFTAHFGNWEMIVPPSSLVAPYHVIARAVDNPLINTDVVRARTPDRSKCPPPGGGVRRFLRQAGGDHPGLGLFSYPNGRGHPADVLRADRSKTLPGPLRGAPGDPPLRTSPERRVENHPHLH